MYLISLYGNRIDSKINTDYAFHSTSSYKKAREILESNGKWGNIQETAKAAYKARQCHRDILSQCLSSKLTIH